MIDLIGERLVPLPPEAQRPRGIAAGLAVRRHREGLTTMEEMVEELTVPGYTPDEVRRYQLQAELEYETDYTMDLIAVYREAFRRDQIDDGEFDELLARLGMIPDRREALIQREVLRKTPRLKAPEPPEVRAITTAQVLRAFREGVFDEARARQELADRGFPEANVDVLVELNRPEAAAPEA
ncbi:MAG: hypothetical protein ACE5IA_02335 [Dehalococcoidia bacterium]